MPAGDQNPISSAQRADLQKAVDRARQICGFGFGAYIGPLPDGRDSAVEQHASLPDAPSAVLVAVDPSARMIEIVTGTATAASLDVRACEFAVLSMKSYFVNDDLVGGLREGVTLLAQNARHPRTLHLDQPA